MTTAEASTEGFGSPDPDHPADRRADLNGAAGKDRKQGTGDRLTMLEISKRPNPWQRAVNVWRYRELLGNLVRAELKVKYKNSILGFLWSLLNPALYLVVFSFVFGVIFKTPIENFALFLMAGLIPWNFFTTAVSAGTASVTGNSGLVQKVWFPREILPIASVGAGAVHFFLQSIVLLLALAVFRQIPSGTYAVILLPALFDLLVFAAALGIGFAAINVYLRDMGHFVELLMLAWFWGTPIVWAWPQMHFRMANEWGIPSIIAFVANPLIGIVIAFQRVLYNTGMGDNAEAVLLARPIWWYLAILGAVGIGSLILLTLALVLFGRLEDNFAEEV